VEAREDGTLGALLGVCASFVAVSNECPVCLVGFLLEFVRGWDGITYRSQILDLLVAIVPSDWEGRLPREWY
jgi:hypothetical protein